MNVAKRAIKLRTSDQCRRPGLDHLRCGVELDPQVMENTCTHQQCFGVKEKRAGLPGQHGREEENRLGLPGQYGREHGRLARPVWKRTHGRLARPVWKATWYIGLPDQYENMQGLPGQYGRQHMVGLPGQYGRHHGI